MTDQSDKPEDAEPCGEPVEIPIEDCLDLHSFRPREVASVVEEYLYQALQRGFRLVRIIHGRGIGIQREIVQSILQRHPEVVSFADTSDRGATIVTLRAQHMADPGSGAMQPPPSQP
jgi:dsDNA-specific endonuclease/ATPase MutS2